MWCDKDSHPATNDSTKLPVLLFQLTAWTKKLASMLPLAKNTQPSFSWLVLMTETPVLNSQTAVNLQRLLDP